MKEASLKKAIYCTRSVQQVSSYVIWKRETFIEEDTRYKKYWTQNNDTAVTSHSSPNCHQLPPSCFSASHRWSEIYSLSKVILVLEKPEVTRHQIRVIGGLSHPGDLMFCQKTAWDVMYEQAHCPNEADNYKRPIAVAFWVIWTVFEEECSSLT